MSTELKVGDVVRLRSGGPDMTVHTVDNDGSVYCQWFENKKLENASFMTATLVKIDPAKRGPVVL